MNYSIRDNSTLIGIGLATLGYFLVVISSAFTGFLLSVNSNKKLVLLYANEYAIEMYYLVIFSILTLPYLFVRESLLERSIPPDLNSYDVKSIAIQTPRVIFVLLYIIAILVIMLIKEDNYLLLFSLISIGLFPFLISHIRTIYLLRNKKENIAYSFLDSILLPSFCVCILPFSFGWSLVYESFDIATVIIASLYISFLYLISIFFKGISNFINFIYIIFFTVLFLLLTNYITLKFEVIYDSKFLIFAIFITLTLGVAEVTKRAYLSHKKNKIDFVFDMLLKRRLSFNDKRIKLKNRKIRFMSNINNTKENYSYYFDSARIVGVTIPLTLAVMSLFSKDISVELFYLIPALQIIHWFIIINRGVMLLCDYLIALILGYLLSIFIISSILFDFEINIMPTITENSEKYFFIFIGIIASVMIMNIGLLAQKVIKKILNKEKIKEDRDTYYLTFCIALIILLFTSFFINFYELDEYKLNKIIIISAFLWVIIAIIHNINKIFRERL